MVTAEWRCRLVWSVHRPYWRRSYDYLTDLLKKCGVYKWLVAAQRGCNRNRAFRIFGLGHGWVPSVFYVFESRAWKQKASQGTIWAVLTSQNRTLATVLRLIGEETKWPSGPTTQALASGRHGTRPGYRFKIIDVQQCVGGRVGLNPCIRLFRTQWLLWGCCTAATEIRMKVRFGPKQPCLLRFRSPSSNSVGGEFNGCR